MFLGTLLSPVDVESLHRLEEGWGYKWKMQTSKIHSEGISYNTKF